MLINMGCDMYGLMPIIVAAAVQIHHWATWKRHKLIAHHGGPTHTVRHVHGHAHRHKHIQMHTGAVNIA